MSIDPLVDTELEGSMAELEASEGWESRGPWTLLVPGPVGGTSRLELPFTPELVLEMLRVDRAMQRGDAMGEMDEEARHGADRRGFLSRVVPSPVELRPFLRPADAASYRADRSMLERQLRQSIEMRARNVPTLCPSTLLQRCASGERQMAPLGEQHLWIVRGPDATLSFTFQGHAAEPSAAGVGVGFGVARRRLVQFGPVTERRLLGAALQAGFERASAAEGEPYLARLAALDPSGAERLVRVIRPSAVRAWSAEALLPWLMHPDLAVRDRAAALAAQLQRPAPAGPRR